jgi:hypothetical protein
VWGKWLLNGPVEPFIELALGTYLVYRWYAAAGPELGVRPWELSAGLIFVLDAIENLAGIDRLGHEVILVYPGLIFLAGVIYLFDRRARAIEGRYLRGFALTMLGALSYYHQYGFMASVPIGNISGILSGLLIVYLWYQARRSAPAASATLVWALAVAASLLIDSVARLAGYDQRWLIVAFPVVAGALYLIEPSQPRPQPQG